jgi:hypothetical protein
LSRFPHGLALWWRRRLLRLSGLLLRCRFGLGRYGLWWRRSGLWCGIRYRLWLMGILLRFDNRRLYRHQTEILVTRPIKPFPPDSDDQRLWQIGDLWPEIRHLSGQLILAEFQQGFPWFSEQFTSQRTGIDGHLTGLALHGPGAVLLTFQ